MKNLLYVLLGTIFILFSSCNDDIHKVLLQYESISADKQSIYYLPDNRPEGICNFQVKDSFSKDYDGLSFLGERNGRLQCSSKVVSYDKKDNKFFLMDDDVGVLWSGNIVSEKSIKGTPTSIGIYGETRNPIEIQMDCLRPTDSPPYAKNEEPTSEKVGQALIKSLTQEFYAVSVTPKANLKGLFDWVVKNYDVANIFNDYV